jgi:opacity protein-like surface antigen
MRDAQKLAVVLSTCCFAWLAFGPAAHAADIPAAEPVEFEAESGWEVSASPFYVWMLSFNGTLGAGGNDAKIKITPIDLYVKNLGSFLDAVDGLYMGNGEIRNGDFGFAYDIIYADISSGQAVSGNILQVNVDVGFSFAFATMLGTYRALENEKMHVDGVAGLRVSNVNLSIGAELNGDPVGDAKAEETWIDPVVGFKFGYNYSEKLTLKGWALIGGFGAGSDFMWDLYAGADYQLTPQFSAFLGFRGGGTDYRKNDFVYDITNWGPMVGIGVNLGPVAAENSGDMASSNEPELASEFDWSGPYAGVGLGYYGGVDQVSLSATNRATGKLLLGGNRSYALTPRGFAGGVFAGYNLQASGSPFMLGIEGDFYGTTAKDSAKDMVEWGSVKDIRIKAKNDLAWSVRGRAGFATGPFMPYITGGYAGLSAKTSLTLVDGANNTRSKSKTYSGWIFGGGLDFMMSPAMVLGAEFRHANYGAKTVMFNYPGVGAVPSGTDVAVRTKIYDNQILFRGAYML